MCTAVFPDIRQAFHRIFDLCLLYKINKQFFPTNIIYSTDLIYWNILSNKLSDGCPQIISSNQAICKESNVYVLRLTYHAIIIQLLLHFLMKQPWSLYTHKDSTLVSSKLLKVDQDLKCGNKVCENKSSISSNTRQIHTLPRHWTKPLYSSRNTLFLSLIHI